MKRVVHIIAGLALLHAATSGAVSFPILAGDPIDPQTGDAYTIFPGLPLISPPLNIDATKIGDVDLVVRAGTPMVGPTIPPPAIVLPTAVAGGTHVASGSEIPFRVIASDGAASPPAGNPLLGAELDTLPAVVFVFADFDGDGIIGPTDQDPAGLLDDQRELQEALFPIGRQVALFENGVATGTVAVSKGAPASAGGLTVLLTAAAYIGEFAGGFLNGNVPQGPPVATMFPFLPKLDADRVIDGRGAGGRAGSEVRIELELEPDIDLPVGHPTLGSPFAIPTNGSSITVDRALVNSGPFARARFVRASDVGDFPALGHDTVPIPLYPGANGALFAPLTAVTVPDDGSGNGISAQLVAVDRLDNITDPPANTSVTVVAGAGVAITAPDTDADPSRETIPLATAAGVSLTIDDAGVANDAAGDGTLDVVVDGYVVDSLVVHFTPGGATTTTLTTTTITSTTLLATTTTTSASDTTTTTTTVPPACAATPTVPSIACRLSLLRLALQHDLPAGKIATRVLSAIDHASLALTDAVDPAASIRVIRRQTRTAQRQIQMARARLRSRIAQRSIDATVLARLVAASDALIADLKLLRATL